MVGAQHKNEVIEDEIKYISALTSLREYYYFLLFHLLILRSTKTINFLSICPLHDITYKTDLPE